MFIPHYHYSLIQFLLKKVPYGDIMLPATNKCTQVITWSVHRLCQISTISGISWQIFIKILNIKFHGTPANGSQAYTCRYTNTRMDITKIIGIFAICKHALKQTRKKSKEKVKRKNKKGEPTNQVLIMANTAPWQTLISQFTLHVFHISNQSSMGNNYFLNPNPLVAQDILSPLTAFHICDWPNFFKSSYTTRRNFFCPFVIHTK